MWGTPLHEVVHAWDAWAMLPRRDFESIYDEIARRVWASGASGGMSTAELTVTRVPMTAGDHLDEKTVRVPVKVPADARGWIGELGTPPAHDVYYRLGHWIVQVRRGDFYAYVFGHDGGGSGETYHPPTGDSYGAMWAACEDKTPLLTDAAMELLTGGNVSFDSPHAARLLVAMLVSESIRNFRTWGANLMLLDLLKYGELSWQEVFGDPVEHKHPMARGGTWKNGGATGIDGGQSCGATRTMEVGIFHRWLQARLMPAMSLSMGAGSPHVTRLTPPRENPRIARQRLGSVLWQRFTSLGFSGKRS